MGEQGTDTEHAVRDSPNAGGPDSSFEREAEASSPGIVAEFWDFLRHSGKWWLAPVVIALLALGALVVLAAGPAAPFIYTLF